MTRVSVAFLGLMFLGAADSKGDPPTYHLVIEAVMADGSHIEKPYDGAFLTPAGAYDQALRLAKTGYCFEIPDPPIPDPLLVAVCVGPDKILQVKVLLY